MVFSSDMVYRSATQDVVSTQLDLLGLQLYRSVVMITGYVMWSCKSAIWQVLDS